MRKRFVSITIAICLMLTAAWMPASAESYYAYDNQMSSIGLELTSALYLTLGDNGVSIEGITRVDAGSSPYYTSFTMYSSVRYSYHTNTSEGEGELSDWDSSSSTVNNISPNSGEYVPIHGYTDAVSWALFARGIHQGWATADVMDMATGIVYTGTILGTATAEGNNATRYSLQDAIEIEQMMS